MNIDDKTINLSTEVAKTCEKFVKTDTEDEAIKAKLNAVYRLRLLYSHPLKTIFQHKACTNKLYADSFYKVQKNSHSSFEVICCCS